MNSKVLQKMLGPLKFLQEAQESDIAQHLTAIEFKYYAAIQPYELLSGAWMKEELKHRATNVLTLITRFNNVSLWVASSILWQERLKDRQRMLQKFIRIALKLDKLNNFNTLLAIIAGLNISAVHRLKFSFEGLPNQTQKDFALLEEKMSSTGSYKNYRGLIHTCNPPVLPYLGVYLTDLTFMEEGNPDYIKRLINFKKRELIYKVIEEIQRYQQKPYNFQLSDPIVSFLTELPHNDEGELYALSLQREPRDVERAKDLP